jgi:hypothetical protein
VRSELDFVSEYSDIQVSGTSETTGFSEQVSSEELDLRVEFQNYKRILDLACD